MEEDNRTLMDEKQFTVNELVNVSNKTVSNLNVFNLKITESKQAIINNDFDVNKIDELSNNINE